MTPDLCKTPGCKNPIIPTGDGYCAVCFERIIKKRKILALERIADSLESITKILSKNPGMITTTQQPVIQPTSTPPTSPAVEKLKKLKKRSNKTKSTDNEMFIPSVSVPDEVSGKIDVKDADKSNVDIQSITSKLSELEKSD